MTGIEPTTNLIIKITEDRKTDQNYIYKKWLVCILKAFYEQMYDFFLLAKYEY